MKNPVDIPSSHTWLMTKMACVGYKLTDKGVCFGVGSVGMNSFFAGKLEDFSNRIKKLASIPLTYFQDNFRILKLHQAELIIAMEFEQTIEIQQFIIEAQAFFDAVVLLQHPDEFNALLEFPKKGNKLYQQDKDFLQLINPLIFSQNPDLEPTKISDEIICGYNKTEFDVFLDLLEDYLGDADFAISLNIDFHQYTLCYNTKIKQWIMIEANRLPPRHYDDSFYLVEDIFENKPNGIMAGSTIYVHKKNYQQMHRALNSMQHDDRFIYIHNEDKITNKYQGYRDGSQIDILISKGFPPTQNMIESIFHDLNEKDILSLLNYLQANGITLTQNMLQYALLNHHFEIVEWLIYNGVCLTKEHLRTCTILGDLIAVDCLIQHGIQVNEKDLNLACFLGNLNMVEYLIDKDVLPDVDILNTACIGNDMEMIKLILEFGIKPPSYIIEWVIQNQKLSILELFKREDITIPIIDESEIKPLTPQTQTIGALYHACLHGNLDEIKILIASGLRVSIEIFQRSLAYGRLNVVEYLIDEHGFLPSLKSVAQLINTIDIDSGLAVIPIPLLSKLLSSVSLDPNQSLNYHDYLDTIISYICFLDNQEIIQILITRGMPISEKMLLTALNSNNLVIAKYLIDMGIKPTEEMLSIFCFNGAYEQAAFLIGQEVNPQIVFKEMCIKQCKSAVVFLLENAVIVDDKLIDWIEINANNFLNLVLIHQQRLPIKSPNKENISPYDSDSDTHDSIKFGK